MSDQQEVVKTTYGPCHKCGLSIEAPKKPVQHRGNAYHPECVPTKKEETLEDNSYT